MLSVEYKILTLIIKNRLIEETEEKVGKYHCRFRKERGVVYQIFIMGEIQVEMKWKHFISSKRMLV